jgi:hypothetical protein
MRVSKKTIIALSIIPQIILVKWLAYYPEIIERYYSTGLYPVLSKIWRFTLGWIPFSVGDLLYTIGFIYGIRWLILNRKRILWATKTWFLDVFVVISLLYFSFHLLWGLNYYRLPVYKSMDIGNEYSTQELHAVTIKLIEKANTIHNQISVLDTFPVRVPYSKSELIELSVSSYNNLSGIFPQFNYNPSSTKQSLFSVPLTYMGFSGYLNPFTNEAQIDGIIPLHRYPTTLNHEQAHQLGYAAENETNFIGCLAAIHNDDIYYQYSGYIFALRHCLNELFRRDKFQYEELLNSINKGILANYQETYDFWMAYQNPLEPLFKNVFDSFLKANNQEKGIESYSYTVALLVNFFKDKKL